MEIGIIGPLDSCNSIMDVMNRSFPDISVNIYEVSQTEEAYLLINRAEKECDGIILTGMGVYYKVIEKVEINKPHMYVPFYTSSIMKAFWMLKEEFPDCTKVSIDVVREDALLDVLDEFKLKDNLEIDLMEYNHLIPEKSYLDFHKKKQEDNPDCVSIIALGWVYEELKNMGYNVVRMYPTKSTIRTTINNLISKINQDIAKESSLAIQVLKIRHKENISQYRKLEINSLVENKLSGYIKEIQGSIFTLSWDRYIIYSTRGAVENLDNLSVLKNIMKFLEKENIIIFSGIGLGKTSRECELNARKALNASIQMNKSSIFKVDGEKIKGPLLTNRNLEYSYIVNSDMIEISETTGVNVHHLEMIKSMNDKYNINEFTSDLLAEYLDVSVRTANRIINKLTESNFAKEVGQEVNKSVGRPKKIIKVTL